MSPAEKYDLMFNDNSLPLTKAGWDVYNRYKDFKENWFWMGHCDGWAAASYNEDAPKVSVIAKKEGREILFSEGDIRALFSMIYTKNRTAGKTRFLGTRCENKTLLFDPDGRVYDGVIYKDRDDKEPKPVQIIENHWEDSFFNTHGSSYILYREDGQHGQTMVLEAVRSLEKPEDSYEVNLYPSIYDFETGKPKSTAIFRYLKPCRDINAASFHLVLVDQISDQIPINRKKGFVLDMSASAYVWNHPVYGFESEILKEENISDENDSFRKYRARGTQTVLYLKTTLHYGLENGPYSHYDENASSVITKRSFEYSLEFDKKGLAIGGEWSGYSNAPDFIWSVSGKPMDTAFLSYGNIKALQACSLEDERAYTVKVGEEELRAANCLL
ncbi:MAG: hypothetical protein HQK54_11580 [Oligoflexales bacterium]|nr:hypothetical protein [Oligoflexales bacterium]